MSRKSHTIIFIVYTIFLIITPVIAISLNSNEYGPFNILHYVLGSVLNLTIYGITFCYSVPKWVGYRRGILVLFSSVLILIVVLLKSTIYIALKESWPDQFFTPGEDFGLLARLALYIVFSSLYLIAAYLIWFSTEWYIARNNKDSVSNQNSKKGKKDKNEKNFQDIIFVKSEYKMIQVKLSDIIYVESLKDYIKINLKEGRVITLMSLKELESMLPEPRFMRIHKSFLISFDKIDSVERSLINIGSRQIPIGKSYRESFFRILKSYQS